MTALSLEQLWQRIAEDPDHVFLATPDHELSYGALGSRIRIELARFDAAGLELGQRLLIRTADETAAIVLFLAGLLDGLVPVMLTPGTPDDRLSAISALVEPGLTCQSASTGHAPADRDPRLPGDPDQIAYILFTSGTTQSPSGVNITRRNILSNLATISRLFGCDRGSRIFNDMVLAHADGLVQGPLLAMASGATLIRSGGFSLQGMELWLDRVRETRATHVITVPTLWSLIDRFAKRSDYFQAPDCRALMSVAAKLDQALWQRIETRFGRTVYNQYGLTETVTSALYAGPHPEMGASGTIGKPVDCAARIEALAGSEVLSDGAGELQLHGDNIFPGYWKNPARSAESFTSDGWFKTGDLARLLPDGSYAFLGRIKSSIIMAGFLIRPDEIDEALMKHPAVSDSVTVAIADAEFDEIPVTAVVLKSEATEAELAAHARRSLEPLKGPKRIIVMDAIPRGDAGKPNLQAVRDLLARSVHSSPQLSGDTGDEIDKRLIELAALVFGVEQASLTVASTPQSVEGWDSFKLVNLVLQAEELFSIRIPGRLVGQIDSLGDLSSIIRKARAGIPLRQQGPASGP